MKLRIPKKGTTWVLIVFIGVAIFSVISPKLDVTEPKKKTPDFSFEDVTISQLDDGKLSWEISAQYAELNKKDKHQVVTLKKAKGQFIVEDKSITFKSDTLDWNSEYQQFIGKGNVTIKSPPITLTGDLFRLEVPIKKIRLEHHSKATIEGHS